MSNQNCIDIGANLTHKSFRKDRSSVIEAAQSVGVSKMIVTGTSLNASRAATTLASSYPDILYATAGVHPHEARQFQSNPDTGTIAALHRLAAQDAVVAIGECGLDFNRDFSPREIQIQCFEAQLELAAHLKMPIFLHERDAHDNFIEILKSHRSKLIGGVVHCFTGTRDELNAYLDLDLHIGITGWICDERRGHHLRELVREIPADRLMVETDAPFLAPRNLPARIQRNEPKYLPHILRTIAKCRDEMIGQLAESSTETAMKLFRL